MKKFINKTGCPVQDTKPSNIFNFHSGGEEIPAGGWRGGEEIPPGGWRGGEEIPKGGWRTPSSFSPCLEFLEQIPPGGWRAYVRKDTYRTSDGRAYFEFGFAQVGSRIEIDILDGPSYGGRADDIHTTHRLKSERGGYKICFGNPSISHDISSAKKWAVMWAEHTWKYIIAGRPFPNT